MAAKQLGMKGKAPETDCGSGLPAHRLKRRLPEGNIDVAIPLPLVYSKGRTEQDVDLDAVYWDHFLRKKKIAGVWKTLGRIASGKRQELARSRIPPCARPNWIV